MQRIRNFVQLTTDIGTSGQPFLGQFECIAENCYEIVINLAMPDHADSIDDEGSIVTGLGMSYFHIPVPFNAPKPDHVRLFCDLMGALENRKIFAHCIMNYRVSAFMYHYLNKVKGLDREASRSPIFEIWRPDQAWRRLINLSKDELGL
jgi:protein tyrosine phosphatase (PTP) superfamily phosphohydrolase (DUF442 family)